MSKFEKVIELLNNKLIDEENDMEELNHMLGGRRSEERIQEDTEFINELKEAIIILSENKGEGQY